MAGLCRAQTADSTVGAGSGLLYFVYQTDTNALTALDSTVITERFDGFPTTDTTPTFLADILSFGTIQTPQRLPPGRPLHAQQG